MTLDTVIAAHERMGDLLVRTPLLESQRLNLMLGHRVTFKMEGFQKTGAFKARGALHHLLCLQEQGALPEHVVAFSSGNHAQGVAWAAQQLGVQATICLPAFASSIKRHATRSYGATVIETATRQEAERRTAALQAEGAVFIHPFDDEAVIAGQGTACLEALQDGAQPDAVFTPLGGGGLTSGTYLALRALKHSSLLFAGEPAQANDAARSCRDGTIYRFADTPDTLADGARTLAVSERTFRYLQHIDGIYEITESELIYWTQWLMHLLKVVVEPTSALAMAAAHRWLSQQNNAKDVLVIVSGSNVARETYEAVFSEDRLMTPPLPYAPPVHEEAQ